MWDAPWFDSKLIQVDKWNRIETERELVAEKSRGISLKLPWHTQVMFSSILYCYIDHFYYHHNIARKTLKGWTINVAMKKITVLFTRAKKTNIISTKWTKIKQIWMFSTWKSHLASCTNSNYAQKVNKCSWIRNLERLRIKQIKCN